MGRFMKVSWNEKKHWGKHIDLCEHVPDSYDSLLLPLPTGTDCLWHKLLKHLTGLESTLLSVSLYQLYAYNGPLCMHVSFSFILSTLLQNTVTLTKLWNKKWHTWTHSMVIFQNLVRCLQGSHFRHHRHTSDVKTAINYRQHNYAAL